MAADGDRIIANLPRTFAALPRPTALAALADAFGGALLDAENSLSAVMLAHWVDLADKGAFSPSDLKAIAALYGLSPRDDETVEGFRSHLKRYLQTFIQGTTTVRGILRIIAEALALAIADGAGQLDTWWNRASTPLLTTTETAADDAAEVLFGVPTALVRGAMARPAGFLGTVDLSQPIDLRDRSVLRLTVDGGTASTTDLAQHLNAAAADFAAIRAALAGIPGIAAEASGSRLLVRTRSTGAGSALELGDIAGDAAPFILGIAPQEYRGSAAASAQIVGAVSLPPAIDLTTRHYLRLTIDGTNTYEVDCAGEDAAATTPVEIVAAINAETGGTPAALAAGRLVLASPTTGGSSSLLLGTPTSGDATELLYGTAPRCATGADALPARVSGNVDLSAGIDLSRRANLALAVDREESVVVDCAGPNPQQTFAGDIATAINAALGAPIESPIATQDGTTVTLTSPLTGPAGRIRFLTAPSGDALDLVFGFGPRRATGADAVSARFTGSADLSHGVNLGAVQRVQIAVDDGTPAIIDFVRAGLAGPGVQAGAIADAINAELGTGVASTEGTHLTLASFAPADQGSVAVIPIETTRMRAFVTRAFPTDEASNTVLGSFAASATGADATAARLLGEVDLHDGLDLRTRRFLRLAIDGVAPRDIDCARGSPRPRAVLLKDLVSAIDQSFPGEKIASIADSRLVLASPRNGRRSRVALLEGGGDASQAIFGSEAIVAAGSPPHRVVFTGLRDLSHGVDLSTADRVRLAIDGDAAREIWCAGANPAATTTAEIAGLINAALGGSYASTDGTFLRLASAVAGRAGEIAFLAPTERDATRLVFGIGPGRTYRGEDVTQATLCSAQRLSATLDLSATPFIRLALGDATPVLIDCRGADPAHTTPAEIVNHIAAAFPGSTPGRSAPLTAAVNDGRIFVTATAAGVESRLALLAAGDSDAGALLLGRAATVSGSDATPATLAGTIDLNRPVDLSQRSVLRLSIDSDRSVDIDIAGAAPDQTFGDEIVGSINKRIPGVASLDAVGHLVLTSPTTGPGSKVALLPLRSIELIEYPAALVSSGPFALKTGDRFTLDNEGARKADVAFKLSSPGGFRGVDLIGLSTGARIHVEAAVEGEMSLKISAGTDGQLSAALVDPGGASLPIGRGLVTAGPLVLTVQVPFAGARPLAAGESGTRPALALVDPLANNVVVLQSTALVGQPAPVVRARVARAAATSRPPNGEAGQVELVGRLRITGAAGELVDGAGATITRVRAGTGITFARFDGLMVIARGQWYPTGAASLLAVDMLAQLFDIQIDNIRYDAVALDGRAGPRSLTARLAAAGGPPVIARDSTPADALRLPRGRSEWLFVSCEAPRFDAGRFEMTQFAGGPCDVPGIFDASRFNAGGDETRREAITGERVRFAPTRGEPEVQLSASWESHLPGVFVVNLPADLPAQFGARFDAARFTSPAQTSEVYRGVALEPADDIVNILRQKDGRSSLVYAEFVSFVPLGWEAQTVPFVNPRTRFLTGGRADAPSAIYLSEPGVSGAIGIKAKENGTWGDQIAVSIRYAGPALFDLSVSYAGARFECGRAIVFAGRVAGPGEDPLPALTSAILTPRPVGVVQAKAAGICASVTRERTFEKEEAARWLIHRNLMCSPIRAI